MIRALIIEDELPIQELIAELVCETDAEIIITGIAGNFTAAHNLILNLKPQLVFLDVMLPGGTAFELLKNIGDIQFEIIFITAYNDFIADAVRYAANGYLVKPVNQPDLKLAIDNAKKHITNGLSVRQIADILELSWQRPPAPRMLALSTFNQYIFIDLNKIVRCESQNMYSYIYTEQKKILSSFSLKQLACTLPEDAFFQVHKSHIISLHHVNTFNVNDSTITMADNTELPISRRRKNAFLDRFIKVSRNADA